VSELVLNDEIGTCHIWWEKALPDQRLFLAGCSVTAIHDGTVENWKLVTGKQTIQKSGDSWMITPPWQLFFNGACPCLKFTLLDEKGEVRLSSGPKSLRDAVTLRRGQLQFNLREGSSHEWQWLIHNSPCSIHAKGTNIVNLKHYEIEFTCEWRQYLDILTITGSHWDNHEIKSHKWTIHLRD
jgi:hypothetical protein